MLRIGCYVSRDWLKHRKKHFKGNLNHFKIIFNLKSKIYVSLSLSILFWAIVNRVHLFFKIPKTEIYNVSYCMITGTYFLNLIFGIILSRHHEVGGPPNGPILVDCLHFIPREVLFLF